MEPAGRSPSGSHASGDSSGATAAPAGEVRRPAAADDEVRQPGDANGEVRVSALRRLARAPLVWLQVLLVPGHALPRIVEGGRFGAVLLCTLLCAGLTVAAIGVRLDMVPVLLREEAHPKAAPGQDSQATEQRKSDREFDEAVEKARAVQIVKLGAGALLVPLRLLLLALGLYLVVRFVGGKPKLRAIVALCAHAGLPGALKSLLAAAVALRQARLTPDGIATLVPPPWGALDGAPLQRLLAALDPFTVWAVVLLAIGLPHAAAIGRPKAYVTLGTCFVLFLLVTL